MTISEMSLGDQASMAKTVSECDVYLFAGITGDFNPAHIDQEAAAAGPFHGRVAHGVLSAGFISAVLGMRLPGPGTIYLGQELRFTKPVRIGDTITATCTVSKLDPARGVARLSTVCTNQRGETVLCGTATVMPPRQAGTPSHYNQGVNCYE